MFVLLWARGSFGCFIFGFLQTRARGGTKPRCREPQLVSVNAVEIK